MTERTMLVIDVCEHIVKVSWRPEGYWYLTQVGGAGLQATNETGDSLPVKCPACGHLCSVRLATSADCARELGLSAEDFRACTKVIGSVFDRRITYQSIVDWGKRIERAARLVHESEAEMGGAYEIGREDDSEVEP